MRKASCWRSRTPSEQLKRWKAAVTALTPYLPAGASCTVTETDAPDGSEALPNASYAWAPVPDPVTVTVPASENPRNANVTNDVRRVHAPFRIVKGLITIHGVAGV
jgi:hypothetical protein